MRINNESLVYTLLYKLRFGVANNIYLILRKKKKVINMQNRRIFFLVYIYNYLRGFGDSN